MINKIWYRKPGYISLLLWPFSCIYHLAIFIRKFLYQNNILKTHKLAVPVIVIGNITVGGTGKTPLTIWLANYLTNRGLKPGIVSRGYHGNYRDKYLFVKNDSLPKTVGDEALLLLKQTNVPLIISKNRPLAAKKLLDLCNCNVIISDDGLQHYALARDFEIIVVDGCRYFGNGFYLPAGPLRESTSRIKTANLVIINEGVDHKYSMQLIPQNFHNLANVNLIEKVNYFKNKTVHAITGIGNPQRFFRLLKNLEIDVIEHSFPDHHFFSRQELSFDDNLPIIMTEKDAVKCQNFGNYNHWFLHVEAKPNKKFIERINAFLNKFEVSTL